MIYPSFPLRGMPGATMALDLRRGTRGLLATGLLLAQHFEGALVCRIRQEI